jgi:membrane associated rhomboid family serine protease
MPANSNENNNRSTTFLVLMTVILALAVLIIVYFIRYDVWLALGSASIVAGLISSVAGHRISRFDSRGKTIRGIGIVLIILGIINIIFGLMNDGGGMVSIS